MMVSSSAVALVSPWSEILGILAFAAILGATLVVLIKLMQRQHHLRRGLPWFVRSMAAVSLLSFLIGEKIIITGYLVFMVLPLAIILGLLVALLIAPIASLIRRSLRAGLRISRRMLEGSILTTVIGTSIVCHLIGEPMVAELNNPEEMGDSMMGLTYTGLVIVWAVIPASLVGSIMGGFLGHSQK